MAPKLGARPRGSAASPNATAAAPSASGPPATLGERARVCLRIRPALTEEEEPGGAAAPQRGYGSVLGVGFAAASTLTAGVGWVLEERYLKAGLFAPSTPVAYWQGSNRTGASRGAAVPAEDAFTRAGSPRVRGAQWSRWA